MGGDGQRLLVWPASCFVFAFRCQVNKKLEKKKNICKVELCYYYFRCVYCDLYIFFHGKIHSALMRLQQRTS